jgi:hypothetical protein
MSFFFADPRHAALPVLVASLCLGTLGDSARQDRPARLAFANAMPRTVLWAWEEPEDLRAADPGSVGVAYLAETLVVSGGRQNPIAVLSRHQPLAVAPGASVMAVVRIETRSGFRDSPELRSQTASLLAAAAQREGIRAFQVDFDATRSERAFYAGVLRQLRPQMPAAMPLSITALASWCAASSGQSWLAGLPIDEAVPMLFRLGGSAQPYADKSWLLIREPLCRGSVGLSTDESWPKVGATERVYLFAPRPWTGSQLAAASSELNGERPAALGMALDSSHRTGINDTGLHPRDLPLADRVRQPSEPATAEEFTR